MKMKAHLLFSLSAGAAAGYLAWPLSDALSSGDVRQIAGTFAAVAATLLGFLMAALAVMSAIMDRPFIQALRALNHYDILLCNVYLTGSFLAATLIVALATLFVQPPWLPLFSPLLAALMTCAGYFMFLTSYRFSLVMRHVK